MNMSAQLEKEVGLTGRNKDDGIRPHGFAATHSVHAFTAFGLYAHLRWLDAKRAGNLFSHQRNVPHEFRAFDANGRIHIGNGATPLIQQAFDIAKKKQAFRVPPLGTRVRKMLADVAERRRAQECITDCVTEGIAIGMTDGAFIERNFDSSQNELAPKGKTMNVIADANAV